MTFSDEGFNEQLVADIKPLLESHYEEIAHYKDIALDPDWGVYENAYKNGLLKIFTVRDSSRLVGYSIFFVRSNPHYKRSVQASQDILFLDKSLRGKFVGARFIKWCDDRLREAGVQAVYHHVKMANNFGPILERMGYKMVDMIYAKRLDQWEEK